MSNPQPATQTRHYQQPGPVGTTSRQAIWSLGLSILTLGGVGSLAGILLGFSARRQIATSGERGNGLAMAGIIVGVITFVLAVAYWILVSRYAGGTSTDGGGGGYGLLFRAHSTLSPERF